MAYVILDTQGNRLTDLNGELIVVATEQEARQWLRPGERAERYSPAPPQQTPGPWR